MLDRLVRLFERIEPIGAGDAVAVERNPVMGRGLYRRRRDRAVRIAPILHPPLRSPLVDAVLRLAANEK